MEHQTVDDADLADKLAAFLEYQNDKSEHSDPNDIDYDAIQPLKDEDFPF
jgi:hypothetical protein